MSIEEKEGQMVTVLIFIAILAFGGITHAERHATTDDGRRVVLRDDGTWRLVEPVKDAEGSSTFRRTMWGMSSEEVADSESFAEDPGVLVTGTLAGFTVHIGYVFADDKLVGANCRLAENHTEKSNFAADFDSLKSELTRRYGEPLRDELVWTDDQFKDYPQFYGATICLGHLVAETQWETDRTIISLVMKGRTHLTTPPRMLRGSTTAQNLLESPEYRRDIVLDVHYEDRASRFRDAFHDLVYGR